MTLPETCSAEARERGRPVRRDATRPSGLDLDRRNDRHDRPGRCPRLRRRHLADAHRQRRHWRLGVHIADVSHFVRPQRPRSRGPQPRHQRLSARPRAADAAGGDLQRPGQPAAGTRSATRKIGLHRIHAEGMPLDVDFAQLGDSSRPAVHLRRSLPMIWRLLAAKAARSRGFATCSRGCTSWP